MTSRKPFQCLLTALAIASGSTVYGGAAQQNLLRLDTQQQDESAARLAVFKAASKDSTAIQLIAQKGSRGDGGGRSSGGDSGGGRSSGGSSGGSSARSSGGSSGGSSAPRSSGGSSGGSSSARSSGGSSGGASAPRISGGSSGGSSSGRSSGGNVGGSSAPRISGGNSGGSNSGRSPNVGGGGSVRSQIGSDAGGSNRTPRIDSTPRVNTPRVDAPRTPAPRNEPSVRSNVPRIDSTPRIDPTPRTPRVNDNSAARVNPPKINPPKIEPKVDRTPRIDSRNNAGGSSNLGGNKLDANTRNNNTLDLNGRGNDANVRNGNKVDGTVRTPRSNTLPGVGDNKAGGAAADRLRDNANRIDSKNDNKGSNTASDRLRDNANRIDNKAGDNKPGDNKAGGVAADRLRDNANRIDTDANNKRDNATDRLRDNANRIDNKIGNDNKPGDVARDNANRIRDNNKPGDNKIGGDNRDRDPGNALDRNALDRIGKGGVDGKVDANARVRNEGFKPAVIRADAKGNVNANDRFSNREKVVIRNNDKTINLTPVDRPGVGARFGRDDIGDRRQALSGLMHQSSTNRNVRYNGRYQDWQSWNGNSYRRHSNWHRGYWNFNRWNGFNGPNWWGFGIGYGGGWGGGWGGNGGWGGGWGGYGGGYGYPLAMSFGLSPWGVNYCSYNFGLYDYYNPYGYQPVPFYGNYSYDYSQPLISNSYVVSSGSTLNGVVADQQPQVAEPDMQLFDQSRSEFQNGNYEMALQLVEQQIQKTPKDSILHEYRGLVLFAMGRYDDAAAPVYAVLAVGPGWDWSTMSTLYSSVDVYAGQLKALEDYHRQNPDTASASFLLGYHYLTCSHNEAAAAQFDNVLRINPQDIVATRLLQAIGDGSTAAPADADASLDDQQSAEAPLAVPEIPALPPTEVVSAEDLRGTWMAQNSKGKTFTLKLAEDGTFEWQSRDDKKSVEQKGVFGVENETLAMEPDGGGVLMGKVTKPVDGTFKMELVGGLPDDAALEFKRAQ